MMNDDPRNVPPLRPSLSSQTSSRPNKRLRLPLSCTECRRRKKPCDGEIPNCDACRNRNVTHLCRYGDDRDMKLYLTTGRAAPSASPSAPTHSNSYSSSTPSGYGTAHAYETSQSASTGPNNITPTDMKQDGDIGQPIMSLEGINDGRKHLINFSAKRDSNTSESRISHGGYGERPTPANGKATTFRPSEAEAEELLSTFRQHLAWDGLLIFDWNHLFSCCNSRMENHGKDTEALILLLSASALEALPSSFAISSKYAGSIDDIEHLVTSWTKNAIDMLLSLDFYFEPSLQMVQAINVYQLYLVHRLDKSLMIRLMDLSLRAARRLGIDRLGSAKDDERAWFTADGFISADGDINKQATLSDQSPSDWAAETFARRDRTAREIARSHWWIIVVRDWSATRQMGSHLIQPSSFTTVAPIVLATNKRYPGQQEDIWQYIISCADISRQYSDLCINSTTLQKFAEVLYDQVLDLHHQLIDLLERRPEWLRPESSSIHLRNTTVTIDVQGHENKNSSAAILVSTLIWHRLYLIHRPFLALGLSGRNKYRLSATRPLNNAMLLLRIERQAISDGYLLQNRSIHLLRLLQSALVIISDQFLRKGNRLDDEDLLYKDPFIIHDTLSHAISTFRTISSNKYGTPKDIYGNVHKRLEDLLRACAKIPNDTKHMKKDKPYSSQASASNEHTEDRIFDSAQQDGQLSEGNMPPAVDMTELWRDLLPFFSV